MSKSRNLAFRTLPLNTTSWVEVIPPVVCSRVVVENGSGANTITASTDTTDPTAQKTIPASAELDIASSVDGAFPPGQAMLFLKVTTGSGPAIVSFIR